MGNNGHHKLNPDFEGDLILDCNPPHVAACPLFGFTGRHTER